MSDCDHDWEIPEYTFGDSYFICRHCRARENVWQRHNNAQEQIATLQSDLAAAREELARAREALIHQWCDIGTLWITPRRRVEAEARYAREIAKVCTYPKCNCMFDMGVDNKCWQGHAMPTIAHKGEEG